MKLSTHKREFQKIASTAVEAVLSVPVIARVAAKTPEEAVLGLEVAEDGDTIQKAVKPLVVFRMFEDAISIVMAEKWGEDMPGRTTKRTKAYYRGIARPLPVDVYEEQQLILIRFPEDDKANARTVPSSYAQAASGALPKIQAVLGAQMARERAMVMNRDFKKSLEG